MRPPASFSLAARGRLSRGVLAVYAALFAATVGALLVNQRLKEEPALVRGVIVSAGFSPDGDGRGEHADIALTPGKRDRVVARILDGRGRVVRVLRRRPRDQPGSRRVRFRWDGRTSAGRPAPDGTYSVRLTLRRRGRTVDLRERISLNRGRTW